MGMVGGDLRVKAVCELSLGGGRGRYWLRQCVRARRRVLGWVRRWEGVIGNDYRAWREVTNTIKYIILGSIFKNSAE